LKKIAARKEYAMLEKIPLFSNLSEEYLRRIESISNESPVKKGTVLFSPGDTARGFFVVLDGAIRVFRDSPKGKEITLSIAEAGSAFAEASVFSDVYHCYAEALKDSTISLIRKDDFLELIQNDHKFAVEWIQVLSLEVIYLHQRIEELSLKSPRARIVSYIHLLSDIQNTQSITLPVHKKSIATLLGMTHETFYRTAKDLENEGLVRFDGQKIDILSISKLEEIVE
jgi:CRP/FNR family transcriptional regulator